MSDIDGKKTIDESQNPEQGSEEGEPKIVGKGALDSLTRQLADEDLKNNLPAVRLILEMLAKLGAEVQDLKGFRDKYYEADKQAGILAEQLNSAKSLINSKTIFVGLGFLFLGFLPSLWTKLEYFIPVAIVGAIMLIVGFFKK